MAVFQHEQISRLDPYPIYSYVSVYCSPDVVELGCYGLKITDGDQHTTSILDKERALLPKLSDQWSRIQNYDLTVATAERDDFGKHSTHQWKPLYHLKQWIDANQELFWENGICPHVICSGTLLRTLLGLSTTILPVPQPGVSAPNYFSNQNAYKFVACKVNGVIYLAPKNQQYGTDEGDWENILRRRKFENLVTTTSEGNAHNARKGNDSEMFFTVLQRTIGNTNLLYSHKVDCEDPLSEEAAPQRYVKLAFRKPVSMDQQGQSSSRCRKLCINSKLNWLESFVLGSSNLLVGYTKNHTLLRCELIAASVIPDNIISCSQNHPFHWSKYQSIQFVSWFFDKLMVSVTDDFERSVYGFEFDCTDTKCLGLTVTQWPAGLQEFSANNIINSWRY